MVVGFWTTAESSVRRYFGKRSSHAGVVESTTTVRKTSGCAGASEAMVDAAGREGTRIPLWTQPPLEVMSRSGGFLDTLNPIAKSRYNQLQILHNYEQSSSLLEEDEDADSFHGDGHNIPMRASNALLSPRSRNIATLEADEHPGSTNLGSEASDEEVPQSFMIETSPSARRKASLPQTRRSASQRAARKGKRVSGGEPLLPTHHPIHKSTRIPHPDDIEEEEEEEDDGSGGAPLLGASRGSNSRRRKGKQRVGPSDSGRQDNSKRGLDEYQQALWRWVNVYNLDEYLQEVRLSFWFADTRSKPTVLDILLLRQRWIHRHCFIPRTQPTHCRIRHPFHYIFMGLYRLCKAFPYRKGPPRGAIGRCSYLKMSCTVCCRRCFHFDN